MTLLAAGPLLLLAKAPYSVVHIIIHRHLSLCLILLQVKDQEFPFNRDLARILVAVEDSNDNIPYFTSTVYDAVAFESSPIGTSVLQVTALDKDNGINGRLVYTMEAGTGLSERVPSHFIPLVSTEESLKYFLRGEQIENGMFVTSLLPSGNTAGVFGIDNTTGLIFIARVLDLTSVGFYTLTVRVTDSGFPPLMATASVRISLVLSDFSKPKFSQKEYQAEVQGDKDGKDGRTIIQSFL